MLPSRVCLPDQLCFSNSLETLFFQLFQTFYSLNTHPTLFQLLMESNISYTVFVWSTIRVGNRYTGTVGNRYTGTVGNRYTGTVGNRHTGTV